MKAIGTTVLQLLVIGIGALIVAFTANAIRADGSIEVSKNYFDTGASRLPSRTPSEPSPAPLGKRDTLAEPTETAVREPADAIEQTSPDKAHDSYEAARGAATQPVDPASAGPAPPAAAHLDHPYQDITFEEVAALVDDPLTQAGLNVFIDARNEQRFSEGRIPGAMLCNPYRVARYIDQEIDGLPMIDHILNAEKVVVYCGGGACEDSIFMARELLELDVAYDAIYIYAGGWSDWVARGGRIEKGRK